MIKMKYLVACAAVLGLAACGDDGGDDNSTDDTADADDADADNADADADNTDDTDDTSAPDAAIDAMPDAAPAATVVAIACPGSPAVTITTPGQLYMPSTATIAVGDIVEFDLAGSHNVIPHPTMPTDPGLRVPFGGNVCLQFTAAGAFSWRCQPHSNMVGTVTVTP